MDSTDKTLLGIGAVIGGGILIFICLIAYIITLPFSFFTSAFSDLLALRQEYLGTSGATIAAIAEQEYDQYGDTVCGDRYWTSPHDWCVDFVWWCADQIDLVGSGNLFGSWTSYVPTAIDQLIANGAEYYGPGDGVTPQPGDIITWWGGGRAGRASDYSPGAYGRHIAIAVEATDYSVTVVEGNAGGGGYASSKLRRNTYSLNGLSYGTSYIYLIIRPNYPASSAGGLNNPYYFVISSPDPSYVGHTVTGLTQSQIASIKNTIYGEYGTDLGGAICVAQSIRDNVDRSSSITYSNFVTACSYNGGMTSRSESVYNTTIVQQAFDYVFNQGGSAVQHPIYCFYAPTSRLQSDADYQALFLLPLEFVIQVGTARFFSWEVN